MKAKFVLITVLLAAIAGCTSNPKESNAEAPRAPSNLDESFVLTDTYFDNQVIFCDFDTAVVVSDPNRCGEARAKGNNGCTEMPVYISEKLKVLRAGSVMDLRNAQGKSVHSLTMTSPNFYTLKGNGFPKLDVKVATSSKKVDPAAIKYYCR